MYFQGLVLFKAKIPHLMKSKVRKYNILRNQHQKFAKNKKLSEIHCMCLFFSQIRARANYNRFTGEVKKETEWTLTARNGQHKT